LHLAECPIGHDGKREPNGLGEKGFLAAEMVVERSDVDPGGLGDSPGRDAFETVAGERNPSSFENALPSGFGNGGGVNQMIQSPD